jgi:outer membrane lipoprotein-sorting protein
MRVSLTSPQGRYSTRQTFLWRRPASIRLETFSPFGQPLMSFVAEREGAAIYYPQQGTFFQGPASATILTRLIGLPLDAAEVAPLLVGSLPTSLIERTAALYQQVDAGLYLLRFLDGQGRLRQDLWVDPEPLLPQRSIRYASAAVPAVDIAYSDFRRIADVPFPFEVRLWVPDAESDIRLQYLNVELNPDLPAEVFQLSPPAGVQVVPLE